MPFKVSHLASKKSVGNGMGFIESIVCESLDELKLLSGGIGRQSLLNASIQKLGLKVEKLVSVFMGNGAAESVGFGKGQSC